MQIGIVGLGRMGGNMARRLARGDVMVDGGNANYKDSQRRGAALASAGIDLAAVAEMWRHGSVVRSWLLDRASPTAPTGCSR